MVSRTIFLVELVIHVGIEAKNTTILIYMKRMSGCAKLLEFRVVLLFSTVVCILCKK